MTSHDVLSAFKSTHALLDGHFVLRSGLHSRQFFQCAMVLQYPRIAENICHALSEKLQDIACDAVISPRSAASSSATKLAALWINAIFSPKKRKAASSCGAAFEIAAGERFIVVEDVVTRGGRVQETIDIVRSRGGVVAAVGVLVDRSEATPDFGCPFISLLKLQVETFEADNLPPDLAASPAVKPGSK